MKEWKQNKIGSKINYSLNGINYAIKTDRSVRIVMYIVVMYIIVALLVVPTLLNKGILIALALLCFAFELLNTSIEKVVDRIGLGYNILSKHAKDIVAGSSMVIQGVCIIFFIFTIGHTIRHYKVWKKNNEDRNFWQYVKYTYHVPLASNKNTFEIIM